MGVIVDLAFLIKEPLVKEYLVKEHLVKEHLVKEQHPTKVGIGAFATMAASAACSFALFANAPAHS